MNQPEESNVTHEMEFEEDPQFSINKTLSDTSQKHSLHVFRKKFSNFSIEDSLIFNWKTGPKNLIYSNGTHRYFENFATLLVYSKSILRLYKIDKFYEDIKGNIAAETGIDSEKYELQLINEYNFPGMIQKILLYEKYDETFFVVSLSETKVFIDIYIYFF